MFLKKIKNYRNERQSNIYFTYHITNHKFSSFLSEFYTVGIEKKVELYPFGTEGPVAGLWQYESAQNYVLYNLITGVLWIITSVLIIFSLLKKNIKLGENSITIAITVYIIGKIIENL